MQHNIKKPFKILIVDDEEDILEFLSFKLEKEGYQVTTANNGKEAIDLATKHKPHLILLDMMMPDMDGLETCTKLRKKEELKETVIAFLTAVTDDHTQIHGLNSGADDYINKPIKPNVLLSKIQALLRRNNSSSSGIKSFGNLIINREKYIVTLNDVEFNLPKKEFELLELLASKPSVVFGRQTILDKVWGDDVIVGDRTIDVHIRKLREKIGENYIKTVKGVGYKFEE
jgi:two-component system, OmpR family, alkaline phosphatase synthesis response regulator PhoP